jgi:hypothetical protein
MAYSTANPPINVIPHLGGLAANSTSIYGRAVGLWLYKTSDGTTNMSDAGYFSNGHYLGMKRGDVLLAVCQSTESSTGSMISMGVLASSNSTGGFQVSTDSRLTSSGQ